MVTDRIDHKFLYKDLGNGIAKALDYLANTDFKDILPGKYSLVEDELFALVNEYTTKHRNECQPEAHQQFIDVQYIVSGIELFGYAPLTNQLPVTHYDEANDVTFFNETMSFLELKAGMFIIFYPTDIHQPEVMALQPTTVKKVVMKIKLQKP